MTTNVGYVVLLLADVVVVVLVGFVVVAVDVVAVVIVVLIELMMVEPVNELTLSWALRVEDFVLISHID